MDKQSTTPAKIKDFTPLMDDLVSRYGLITAAIWGRMWRYAQGKRGICDASIETIARELDLSRRTVIRHITTLENDGYLIDTTPTARHRPHVYRVTGEPDLDLGVTESPTGDSLGVTESPTGVSESPTELDRESLKETERIKKHTVELPKNGNSTPTSQPLSDGQSKFLEVLGAKQYRTKVQRDKVKELEDKYGLPVLTEYVTWAATKGMRLGDAIVAAERSLPKWGKPKESIIRIEAGKL